MLLSSTLKRLARRATGPPPPARHEALQFSEPPDMRSGGFFFQAAALRTGFRSTAERAEITEGFFSNPKNSARSARSAVDGKQPSSLPERHHPGFLARESDRIAQAVIQGPGAGYGTDQKHRLRLVRREHGDAADTPHTLNERLLQHHVADAPEIDALVALAQDAALDLQPLDGEGVPDGAPAGEGREQIHRPEQEAGGDRACQDGRQRALVADRGHRDRSASARSGAPEPEARVGPERRQRPGLVALGRDQAKLRAHGSKSTIAAWTRCRGASSIGTR